MSLPAVPATKVSPILQCGHFIIYLSGPAKLPVAFLWSSFPPFVSFEFFPGPSDFSVRAGVSDIHSEVPARQARLTEPLSVTGSITVFAVFMGTSQSQPSFPLPANVIKEALHEAARSVQRFVFIIDGD